MKNHRSCVKIKQPEKRDFFRGKKSWQQNNLVKLTRTKREDEQTVRYAIIRLDLGVTRLGVGWTLFNTENKAFEETKPRDVKKLLLRKGVKGLTVDNLGDLTVDTDFTEDLAAKSGVGNYRLCLGGFNPKETRQVFIVVSKQISEFGDLYEVISQYYQHLIVDEDELINWLEHGDIVGGIDYNPLHHTIDLKPGVPVLKLNRPETNDIIGLAGALKEIREDDAGEVKEQIEPVEKSEEQVEEHVEPVEKSEEQVEEQGEHVEPAEEQVEPTEEHVEPVNESEESEGSSIEKVEDSSDDIQHNNDKKSESEDPSLLSESKMNESENNSEDPDESLTGMDPVTDEDLLNMLNNSENNAESSSDSSEIPEVSMEELISNPQEPDMSNLKYTAESNDSAEPAEKPKPTKRSHHKKR